MLLLIPRASLPGEGEDGTEYRSYNDHPVPVCYCITDRPHPTISLTRSPAALSSHATTDRQVQPLCETTGKLVSLTAGPGRRRAESARGKLHGYISSHQHRHLPPTAQTLTCRSRPATRH